jgi:hypothetical protein
VGGSNHSVLADRATIERGLDGVDEMAIDKDVFIASFVQQIKLMTDLQSAVTEAIQKAQGQLDALTKGGKSVEQVFGYAPPKQ